MDGMRDDDLRAERLVFYAEDIARIDAVLEEFLEASAARCVLLVDREGHMVTHRGDTTSFDLDTVCALVAGSFAATKEMARLIGETEFSVLFHQGRRDNIQLTLVGDRTLLTVIFDDKTTLGMVRLYATEAARRLEEIFAERRAALAAEAPAIGEDYSARARGRLEDVLGEG